MGYASAFATDLRGLPGGGFAVAGMAENAALRKVPFVAYIAPSGVLSWARMLTEYSPTIQSKEVRIMPGPSGSIGVVVQDFGANISFIHRLRLDGSAIGFRGAMGPASGFFRPVGEQIGWVRSVGRAGSTVTWSIELWRHDAIRTAAVQTTLTDELEDVFFAEFGDSIYFSLGSRGAIQPQHATGRIDSVGNLRWIVRSAVGVRQWTQMLKPINNTLYWSIVDDPLIGSAGSTLKVLDSFGTSRVVPGHGLDVDVAGPLAYGTGSVSGSNWDGSFRFSVSGPNAANHLLTLPQGRIAAMQVHSGVAMYHAAQAAVLKPDTYNYRMSTPATVAASSGVLANDMFVEGLATALVAPPARGAVTLRTDGSFDYTPSAGFVGSDSFRYRVNRLGMTTEASATLLVRAPGDIKPFFSGNPKVVGFGRTVNLVIHLERATAPGSILVSSNHPGVTVPATVPYPTSATTVTIPVTVSATTPGGGFTITARSANYTYTWDMQQSVVLFSGTVSTTGPLRTGGTITATIRIDRPAPTSLGVVIETDGSNLVNVPSVVTIPAGATSVSFPIRLRNIPVANTVLQLRAYRGPISTSGVVDVGP